MKVLFINAQGFKQKSSRLSKIVMTTNEYRTSVLILAVERATLVELGGGTISILPPDPSANVLNGTQKH